MTLFDALRPYLWLAAVAFVVGFLSYFAVGPSTPAVAHETLTPVTPLASPVSDEWNLPKRI